MFVLFSTLPPICTQVKTNIRFLFRYDPLMPKVSPEYRDARRAQILGAARRCFLRNGFHETSMQDVFAEARLSSGAVYRYFDGKEDMIVALAEENMREVVAMIHGLATNDPQLGLGAALAQVLEVVGAKQTDERFGAMAVLVWSEALRNKAIAKRFEETLAPMRADLTEVVRQHQANRTLPADAPADAIATLLMSVIPGFILQLALFGPETVKHVPDAARALWPS
jgi:TetR/AcrR family transcriptional regulator, transcriptional repressor of aconitase